MARKRGEYQKRQERKMRNRLVFGLMLLVVTILFCVYGIIESRYTIRQIDDNTLTEYTGKYSYEYVNRRRIFARGSHSYYKITLDNGVAFTLSAGRGYSENFDNNPVIHVQYFQEPFRNLYTAVSVTAADGDVTIKSLENSKKSSVSLILSLSILIVIFALFSVFFLMLLFEKQIKRFLKIRKKRRKMRKQIKTSK